MQAHLHRVEVQATFALDHDLAVERRVRRHQLAERTQLGEVTEERTTVAAPERELASVVLQHTAEAIPFRLVLPAVTLGQAFYELRLHGWKGNVRSRHQTRARPIAAGRQTSLQMSARQRRGSAPSDPRMVGLFRALCENGVLCLLGNAELEHALSGYLDRLTGSGVAAHACLAVHDDELADTRNGEAVPGFLVRERGELIEELPDLLLRHAGLFRQPIQGLRLRDPSHLSLLRPAAFLVRAAFCTKYT